MKNYIGLIPEEVVLALVLFPGKDNNIKTYENVHLCN